MTFSMSKACLPAFETGLNALAAVLGKAEAYAAEMVKARRHASGDDDPETKYAESDLALAYVSEGKFEAAEPLARSALDYELKKEPDDWNRFRLESILGASLAGQKKYAEAEGLLLSGYQGLSKRAASIGMSDHDNIDRAHKWLLQLYQDWGKPAKVAEWRKQ